MATFTWKNGNGSIWDYGNFENYRLKSKQDLGGGTYKFTIVMKAFARHAEAADKLQVTVINAGFRADGDLKTGTVTEFKAFVKGKLAIESTTLSVKLKPILQSRAC